MNGSNFILSVCVCSHGKYNCIFTRTRCYRIFFKEATPHLLSKVGYECSQSPTSSPNFTIIRLLNWWGKSRFLDWGWVSFLLCIFTIPLTASLNYLLISFDNLLLDHLFFFSFLKSGNPKYIAVWILVFCCCFCSGIGWGFFAFY